jgi:hypothetical protein
MTGSGRPLPINLPTALRLAGARALDIAIAAERIRVAAAMLEQAQVLWLPTITLGGDYNRHDGKNQDTQGNVFNNSRSSGMLGAGSGIGPAGIFNVNEILFAPLVARLQLEARQADLQASANDTLVAVSDAYLNAQQARDEHATGHQHEESSVFPKSHLSIAGSSPWRRALVVPPAGLVLGALPGAGVHLAVYGRWDVEIPHPVRRAVDQVEFHAVRQHAPQQAGAVLDGPDHEAAGRIGHRRPPCLSRFQHPYSQAKAVSVSMPSGYLVLELREVPFGTRPLFPLDQRRSALPVQPLWPAGLSSTAASMHPVSPAPFAGKVGRCRRSVVELLR